MAQNKAKKAQRLKKVFQKSRRKERLDPQVVKWREIEGMLVSQVGAEIIETLDKEIVLEAHDQFFCDHLEIQDKAPFSEAFESWFMFNYDLSNCPGYTDEANTEEDHHLIAPIMLYLVAAHEEKSDLADDELAFINEAIQTPYSFYSVQKAIPGQGLALEDILLGKKYFVEEIKASKTLERGDIIYTKVLIFEPHSLLHGCFPYQIGAGNYPQLVDFRSWLQEELSQSQRSLDREGLLEFEYATREFFFSLISSGLQQPYPKFVDSEGNEIRPLTLRYKLTLATEESARLVSPLCRADDLELAIKHGNRDAHGKLLAFEVPCVHNPRSDDPPILLAHMSINEQELRFDVLTVGAADEIASKIETIFGSAAELLSREETVSDTFEQFMTESLADPASLSLEALPPELQELLQKQFSEQQESWFTEEIPFLGNLTPLEAAKTPEGRELLDALFRHYEQQQAKTPNLSPYNIQQMKERLGLWR